MKYFVGNALYEDTKQEGFVLIKEDEDGNRRFAGHSTGFDIFAVYLIAERAHRKYRNLPKPVQIETPRPVSLTPLNASEVKKLRDAIDNLEVMVAMETAKAGFMRPIQDSQSR